MKSAGGLASLAAALTSTRMQGMVMASCISLAIGLNVHHLPCHQRRLHFRQSELLCHALFRHPPRGSWGPPAMHAALQQWFRHGHPATLPLASTLGMLRRIRK